MIYYRCKCGDAQAWGSLPPEQCDSCSKCRSNLATGPSLHREPKAHEFTLVNKVMTDEGEKDLTYCRYCTRTKHELEKLEKVKL